MFFLALKDSFVQNTPYLLFILGYFCFLPNLGQTLTLGDHFASKIVLNGTTCRNDLQHTLRGLMFTVLHK